MELKELESAIEGILFAAGDPVPVERICLTLERDRDTVESVCQRLADHYRYERRGIRLVRMENTWQMCSAPEQAEHIRKAFDSGKAARLSQPALEVLAIIAYFQPVTRAFVEQVRGVDSAYTVNLLLEREMIAEAGRLAAPGRPVLLKTTDVFLRTFALSALEELPELPDFSQEGAQLTMELAQAIHQLRQSEESGDGPSPEGAG